MFQKCNTATTPLLAMCMHACMDAYVCARTHSCVWRLLVPSYVKNKYKMRKKVLQMKKQSNENEVESAVA